MNKNTIITIILILAVVFLGIYAGVQWIEINKLKSETIMLKEELKNSQKRADLLSEETMQEAARAVMNEAKLAQAVEQLKQTEEQLSKCN